MFSQRLKFSGIQLNFVVYHLLLPTFTAEHIIHWIISDKRSASQGISSVHIAGGIFHKTNSFFGLKFSSHGLVYFEYCVFLDNVEMYFYRSQFEKEPDLEKIKQFARSPNYRAAVDYTSYS